MSPQFVDFNGDGNLDIVAGIFDGSPYVALGDGNHWQQPTPILDKNGDRIVLNAYWDYENSLWANTHRCDPEQDMPTVNGKVEIGHLTSAIALDWDYDGDLDLVLGDHKGGYVYLRRNMGSNQAPEFATKNEVVMANGQPMHDPGTVTTLRSIDWNGDGKLDLMVGGMGNNPGNGGGVRVYLNKDAPQTMSFGKAMTLIAPSSNLKVSNPTRPVIGLYPDAVDVDGDGDLDLIVGGYSHWTPKGAPLSPEETAELAKLKNDLIAVTKESAALQAVITSETKGLEGDARIKKHTAIYDVQRPQRSILASKRLAITTRIEELEPQLKRESFTWLYENTSKAAKQTNQNSGQR